MENCSLNHWYLAGLEADGWSRLMWQTIPMLLRTYCLIISRNWNGTMRFSKSSTFPRHALPEARSNPEIYGKDSSFPFLRWTSWLQGCSRRPAGCSSLVTSLWTHGQKYLWNWIFITSEYVVRDAAQKNNLLTTIGTWDHVTRSTMPLKDLSYRWKQRLRDGLRMIGISQFTESEA